MILLFLYTVWSDAMEGGLGGAAWLLSQPKPFALGGQLFVFLVLPLCAICADLSARDALNFPRKP